MEPQTYSWLLVGHVVGFTLWIAGLVTVCFLLRAHHEADAASRPGLTTSARAAALLMDLGATAAIALGLWMALGGTINQFKNGAWLHLKLTLVVVVILGAHGFLRMKLARARRGQTAALPRALLAIVLLATIVVIALGANRALLRG
jgi:putative membrane protein